MTHLTVISSLACKCFGVGGREASCRDEQHHLLSAWLLLKTRYKKKVVYRFVEVIYTATKNLEMLVSN